MAALTWADTRVMGSSRPVMMGGHLLTRTVLDATTRLPVVHVLGGAVTGADDVTFAPGTFIAF